jgi:hypothetical protein
MVTNTTGSLVSTRVRIGASPGRASPLIDSAATEGTVVVVVVGGTVVVVVGGVVGVVLGTVAEVVVVGTVAEVVVVEAVAGVGAEVVDRSGATVPVAPVPSPAGTAGAAPAVLSAARLKVATLASTSARNRRTACVRGTAGSTRLNGRRHQGNRGRLRRWAAPGNRCAPLATAGSMATPLRDHADGR